MPKCFAIGLRAVFAVLSLLPNALAQWTQWTPNPPTPAPGVRNHAAMAFDAARGQTFVFGGYNGTPTPLGDFWAFDGAGWQQLGGPKPSARWGHGMVYDTRRERLVLFGGFRPSPGNPFPDAVAFGDTWEYDGSTWTQVASTGPSPRGYFGCAYDPIRQRTVLFGGAGPNATYLQDTWEWNGATWTAVNPATRPSVRRAPAMAFDIERAEVVLFGGGALGTQFGDTWVYNGTTWTQRTPATSPPARWEAAMAYDPTCGRALLHGGATFSYAPVYGDTWQWDGFNWTQTAGAQPSPRHGAAVAFDLQAGRVRSFGGRGSAGFLDEFWERAGGCNRTMATLTPAVAGQTAQYRYSYPPSGVGNIFHEVWTLRNPSAFLLPIPGFVPVGLTRVDVFFILLLNAGVLGPSGQQDTLPFAVPYSPSVVGFTYDVQCLDVDLSNLYVYWADNDVEETVAVGATTASFTASPTIGTVPLTVQFADTSTFATSWQWDFQNDGVIDSTQQNPSFVYTSPGTFNVRLVATGPGGSNAVTQAGLITTVEAPSFMVTPSTGASAPLTVQFAGSASFPVTQWAWDFQNDGTNDALGQNPTFTYTANGVYSVRLTVTTTVAPFTRTLVRPGAVFVNPIFGTPVNAALDMVVIAPGTYQRGSPVTPLNVAPYYNQADAQPVHPVTISRPFWIGRYEVTQAQYQAVMGGNPSSFQGPSYPNAAQRPVEQVSWNNAVAYCTALTASEQAAGRVPAGYVYRLPTEAEWEYCCRAGTTTEFHFGPTLVCGQANFGLSYHSNTNCTINQTAVVGSYAPNAWGLHDMHGNVSEWCHDAWDGSANYPSGAVTDPFVASGPNRVLRGGFWFFNSSNHCRSAFRSSNTSSSLFGYYFHGFRVVLAPLLQ
jgi:formylglycine-generating enzyme required for sulfatase activity